MNLRSVFLSIAGSLLLIVPACAGSGGGDEGAGSGGAVGSGGSGSGGSGSGGHVGSGGAGSGGSGSGGSGSGGSGSGGTVGSGGTGSGGSGTGGAASGGAGGSGGVSGTGGVGSGGSGSGGTTGSGGAGPGGTGGGGRGGSGSGGATGSGGSIVTGSGGLGSGGAGAGGGSGAGGSTSSCAAAPVSPGATAQATNLLCYLYSQYGNHVLSGQQETSWSSPANDITWYATNNMKPPAVLGGDFLYRDGGSCTTATGTTTRAIAYWNAGGIPMIRYHMGMPAAGLTCNDDCYMGSNCAEPTNGNPSAAFFTNVITAGTPENTSLNAKLDYVAVQIKAMADANVPVLLALFHETQSNGWFWWAMTTNGPSFVNLWKYSFNYLTQTKGLKNIIWLMPYSGSPSSAFYPGKGLIDLAGPDTYATNDPFSSTYSGAKAVIGSAVPIPLHETGLIPTPSKMFPSTAPWVLFNIWAGYQSDGTHNTTANIQSVYADSRVVTRDKVPSLK
jgi:hypothetical protein